MPLQYAPYNTYSQQWNSPMPWQPCPNTTMQTPPWQQGWRGYNQGNMPPQPYPTYSQYPPQYPQNRVNPSNPSIPQLQPPPKPLQL